MVNRIYLHLVLHGIFRHMIRRKGREEERYSLACDIVTESIIDGMRHRCVLRSRSWLRRETYRRLGKEMKVLTAEKVYGALEKWNLSEAEFARLAGEFRVDDHLSLIHIFPLQEKQTMSCIPGPDLRLRLPQPRLSLIHIYLEAYKDTGPYTNIALFGLDSRNDELDGGVQSDCIMIASINNDTSDVTLTSIYRDTLLQQKDGTYEKALSLIHIFSGRFRHAPLSSDYGDIQAVIADL